jgi:hypothetical protein
MCCSAKAARRSSATWCTPPAKTAPKKTAKSSFTSRDLRDGHAILLALGARFPQAEACSTIAGIKEFDAGSFESLFHDLKGGAPGLVHTSLELSHSNDPDSRPFCQVLLTPVEESAGCPALCGSDHETG